MQDLNFIEQNVMSPYKEILSYETLWALEGIKEKKLREYFEHYTPSETLYKLSEDPNHFGVAKIDNDIKEKVDEFLSDSLANEFQNFSIVVNKSFQYPDKLNKTTCPIGLFYYKGNLDLLHTKCISIVGARNASPEGIKRARRLSKELSEKGFTIVSGLAKGIDTAAHQSAIENNGRTI